MKMFNLAEQKANFAIKFTNLYDPRRILKLEPRYGTFFIALINTDYNPRFIDLEPCTFEHSIFKEEKGLLE